MNINLMIIEDNQDYIDLLINRLEQDKHAAYTVRKVGTLSDAEKILMEFKPDAILLDLNLPDVQGHETVERLQRSQISCPVIILTAQEDESLAIESIRIGIQDYVIKGQGNERSLSKVIRYAIERYRLQETIREESLHDSLTGLYNRRGLLLNVVQQLKLAVRQKKSIVLFLFDLDGLKIINDEHGHLRGDYAIKVTGKILQSNFRESDIVARIGGDEFAAFAYDTKEEHIPVLIKRIEGALRRFNETSQTVVKLSWGAAAAEEAINITFIEQLMTQADKNLYANKKAKKKQEADRG